MRCLALAAAVLAAGASALPARAAAPAATLRRFALVIGANDGGPDRLKLHYATSDAQAMARVLQELGGVAAEDDILVLEPDRAALAGALIELSGRLGAARAAGKRLELIVYYSGHSDDVGLLLKGERFGYDELRKTLNAVPADVRVAILDSCSSGALTRQKGGTRRAPFLVEGAAQVRGHAYLTSSSEHEAAQESDRLQASYFTHFLISGLRGAADATNDGRVTLNEAYQFAFAETLRQTEKTQAGAQHPAYDIQLQGSGDLVMTDLRATSSSLALAPELSGRFFIHDAQDQLIAELYKPVGRQVELGLVPGTYSVRLDKRDQLFEATVKLEEGKRFVLGQAAMVAVSRELTAMRGGEATAGKPVAEGAVAPPADAMAAGTAEADLEQDMADASRGTRTAMAGRRPATLRTPEGDEYPIVPFGFSVLPNVSSAPSEVVKNFSLNLIAGRTARVYGLELGLGLNRVTEEMRGGQLALGINDVQGDFLGYQEAGINRVAGTGEGVQSAILFNSAGRGKLVQFASLFNAVDGELLGVQAAGLMNHVAGPARTVQVAGIMNDAGGGLYGVQAAGVFNLARGETQGVQVAGVANVARAAAQGVQVGGVANVAREGFAGFQAAGLINVAVGNVTGTQVGVINVATGTVDGAQIGVLNVADDVDVPIGLFNFVRKGQLHLDVWTSSDEAFSAGVRFGGKHAYTMLFASSLRRDVLDTRSEDWLFGFGIGAHITRGDFFADIDVLGGNTIDSWTNENGSLTIGRLRLALGWQIQPHLALYVGPTANVLVGWRMDMPSLPQDSLLNAHQRVWRTGDTVVRLWPGLVAGIQI